MSSKYDTDDYELHFSINWKRITPKINCPVCNGNGKKNIDNYYIHSYTASCYNCEGTGKVYPADNTPSKDIPIDLMDDIKAAWKQHNFPQVTCPNVTVLER